MKNNTRPGLRTTEFWLALAIVIGSAVAATYSETDIGRMASLVAAALVTAGYGFTRSGVKRVEVAGNIAAKDRLDLMKMQAAQAAQQGRGK